MPRLILSTTIDALPKKFNPYRHQNERHIWIIVLYFSYLLYEIFINEIFHCNCLFIYFFHDISDYFRQSEGDARGLATTDIII